MDEMGWNQSDLARAADCARQTVSSWMNGTNKKISAEFAVRLQTETRFDARWIVSGEGEPRLRTLTPDEERLLAKVRELPEKRREALNLLLDL